MRAAGGTHDGLEAYFHNRFWCHFGPPFCKSLLAQRIQNLVFFSPVPRWFFGSFFESKFRHLGCSCGRYCKRHVFAEVGIVRFRGGICFVFRVLGSVFMAFGALDAGLNFSDFHGCSWGGGTSKASSRVVMISLPNAGSKQASPPPSSEKRNGGHLISDTGDPSQPVAPLTRGRQICFDYHDNTKKYYELP